MKEQEADTTQTREKSVRWKFTKRKGERERLTMGKSRGERRVIFSSSGAIPTIHDLRRPRARIELRFLGKDGSGERAFVMVEEAIIDVDEVEATNGAEAGRQRDSDEYAIRGGAC